ncbi:MAG: thiamine phosphate synthase [Rhodospirillales bacterium]|nr:thiamine phosphate synthase [Rhodospirillales bacterium]
MQADAPPAQDRGSDCRLYLITPSVFELDGFVPRFEDALAGGPVGCVQLRMKEADDAAVVAAMAELLPRCREQGVPLVLNDRAHLVDVTDADGLHVGAEDLPAVAAREQIGPDRVLGVSCYDSKHAAMEAAARADADYVAFGAFFPTTTKTPRARPSISLLEEWGAVTVVPAIAIGGITPGNCGTLAEAGAAFVAVVSAVWEHPEGPSAAVAAFTRALGTAANRQAGDQQ